jgi:membrane protein
MPHRQPLWSLLAYAALTAVALARRGEVLPPDRRPAPPRENRPRSLRAQQREERAQQRERRRKGEGKEPAASPWRMSWSGWKTAFRRTFDGINDNRLMSVAAGVVFYGLLAIFPALAALVGLYGLFADASTIDSAVSSLSGVLPGGALDLVHEELKRLAASPSANGVGFVVGLLVALWSANSGTKAIIDALNVAYEEKEQRSFIRLNLVSLGYTLIGMAAIILAVAAVVVVPIVISALGLGGGFSVVLRILRWPVLLALVIVGLAAAYRYLPCRREPRWQWLTPGSVLAAIIWFAASLLFSWYIANFGTYNKTYGSLGAAVGMMTWMWISMVVVLAGAQLNAEVERETSLDPSRVPKP